MNKLVICDCLVYTTNDALTAIQAATHKGIEALKCLGQELHEGTTVFLGADEVVEAAFATLDALEIRTLTLG